MYVEHKPKKCVPNLVHASRTIYPFPAAFISVANFTSTAHVIAMMTTCTVLIEYVYSCFILDRYKLSFTQHALQFFITIISTQSNNSLFFLVLMMLAPGDLVGSSKNAPGLIESWFPPLPPNMYQSVGSCHRKSNTS